MKSKRIDGNHVLYHYFQKDLLKSDEEIGKKITHRLIHDLSIWFPLKVYQKIPILRPYVIRDATCRQGQKKKRKEQWGACNSEGYFRDDNSLLKSIPKKFRINSKKEYLSGKMGNGFVASHVWRVLTDKSLASKNCLTNSFVPNLVWLPKQISKLTDREGSYAQKYLQALSVAIYSKVKLEKGPNKFSKMAWKELPKPKRIKITKKEVESLNFFKITEEDLQKMNDKLLKNLELILSHKKEQELHCSRYFKSYDKLTARNKEEFEKFIKEYKEAITSKNNVGGEEGVKWTN
jgi:hypothetical protein